MKPSKLLVLWQTGPLNFHFGRPHSRLCNTSSLPPLCFFFFLTFISFYLDLALSLSILLQQWRWHCLSQGLWLAALLNKAYPVDLPNSAVSINPSSSLLHFLFSPCFYTIFDLLFLVHGAMHCLVSVSTHVTGVLHIHTRTYTCGWADCSQPRHWLHGLCWIKSASGEIPRLNWLVSEFDGLLQPGNLTCLINPKRQICF